MLEVTNKSGEKTKLTIFILDKWNESIDSLTKEIYVPPSKKMSFGWIEKTIIPLPVNRSVVIYDNVADRCTLSIHRGTLYETTLSVASVEPFESWDWGD